MKWKQMFLTIVMNIFLMLLVSLFLEYSNLTERFVSVEDTVSEALELAISESVHSEEFFSAQYQSKLMSYAGIDGGATDQTASAITLVWKRDSGGFEQVNTYQFAEWYWRNGERLPANNGDIGAISNIGVSDRYGLSGHVFEWLYGSAGSSYRSPGLAYGNKNSARLKEYEFEATSRSGYNNNFQQYYMNVGNLQHTVGYLKAKYSEDSYRLEMTEYPVLCNMGLSWMDSLTTETSNKTADNLCSSLHVGKSRYGALDTYYFLTPSSLGVTYVPYEVLKPVFKANLDTIVRLNKLGANSHVATTAEALDVLASANNCVETSVYVVNFTAQDAFENTDANSLSGVDANGHAVHIDPFGNATIVTDGLVEFDLSTVELKIDYFYWDFNSNPDESAILISKLNGTLSSDSVLGGVGSPSLQELRDATLQAFKDQDSSQFVSPFASQSFWANYESVGRARIVARVTAKIKVHVPYRSGILQWANYMFTGTRHFDIKQFDWDTRRAVDYDSSNDNDGIWYQYTTYFCTSRS